MILKLPKWLLVSKFPSIYDTESLTAIEQTARVYGKVNELVESYNEFVTAINDTLEDWANSDHSEEEAFRVALRQEFQDFINVVDLKTRSLEQYIRDNLTAEIKKLWNELKEEGTLNDLVNESLLEISEELERIEKTFTDTNSTLSEHSGTLSEHSGTLSEHSGTLSEHSGTLSEHSDTLSELSTDVNSLRLSLHSEVNTCYVVEPEDQYNQIGELTYKNLNDNVNIYGDITITPLNQVNGDGTEKETRTFTISRMSAPSRDIFMWTTITETYEGETSSRVDVLKGHIDDNTLTVTIPSGAGLSYELHIDIFYQSIAVG